jgi:hypothetical protein
VLGKNEKKRNSCLTLPTGRQGRQANIHMLKAESSKQLHSLWLLSFEQKKFRALNLKFCP